MEQVQQKHPTIKIRLLKKSFSSLAQKEQIVHIIADCCHTEGTAFKYNSKKSLRKAGMSKLLALGFCLFWLMFQSIDGTRADLRNTNDGVPALKGEFPHQVSLRFMQDDGLLHFCR